MVGAIDLVKLVSSLVTSESAAPLPLAYPGGKETVSIHSQMMLGKALISDFSEKARYNERISERNTSLVSLDENYSSCLWIMSFLKPCECPFWVFKNNKGDPLFFPPFLLPQWFREPFEGLSLCVESVV